jgi:hypothetical protein
MKLGSLVLLVLAFVAQSMGSTIHIATANVPNGLLKDAYLGVITAAGGCAPYTWKVVSGALPTGVTKKKSSSTTSLTLSGTPTKAKSYSFTISATDCGGHAVQAAYEVVVQANADHVVDLNWNASSTTDIVGYNVYRGPDGKSWNKINASLAASTTYSDSTVADSSIYYYAATAVDVMGNESDKSNLAKSKVP